ncbi:hypothetical protein J4220_00945 [Candidatus Micrarchaeota archaeon]|nr:hypothetical protein [Candidatus Micrarchaeota archaeon]
MRFKGQAFETMMLVISVIVALAILGVLLNILGGLSFGVGDPNAVMQEGLKTVQSKGFGIITAKKATFEKDALILKRSVIQDVPIAEEELQFACGGTAICNADNLDVTNDKIEANRRIEAQIVVCGDNEKADVPKYCVGVGRSAEEARTACTDKCGIGTTS